MVSARKNPLLINNAMNFRPERKEDLELNITPLVDVVFLLLIFFMVSTTFDRKSEIRLRVSGGGEIDCPAADRDSSPCDTAGLRGT